MNNIPKARNRTLSSDTRLFFREKKTHSISEPGSEQGLNISLHSESISQCNSYSDVYSCLQSSGFVCISLRIISLSENEPKLSRTGWCQVWSVESETAPVENAVPHTLHALRRGEQQLQNLPKHRLRAEINGGTGRIKRNGEREDSSGALTDWLTEGEREGERASVPGGGRGNVTPPLNVAWISCSVLSVYLQDEGECNPPLPSISCWR